MMETRKKKRWIGKLAFFSHVGLAYLLFFSCPQMDGEIAWKRAKSVEKELEGLAIKIKPFVATAKSHQEAVDRLVQNLYETLTGFKGKAFPDNWEHAHNQNITAYRLYYHYDTLDPSFPDAVSPRDLVVPTVRPEKAILASAAPSSLSAAVAAPSVSTSFRTTAAKAAALPVQSSSLASTNPSSLSSLGHHNQQQQHLPHHNSNNSVEMAALLGGEAAIGSTSAAAALAARGTGGVEERRRLMEEVRAHLDLLKQFEGAVPENEINQRKRELFAILPSLSGSLAALTAAESSSTNTTTTTANNSHSSSAGLFGGNNSSSSLSPPPAKKAKGEGLP
jgi:hypothetical protein